MSNNKGRANVKKAKISQDPNNNSSVSVREAHMPNSRTHITGKSPWSNESMLD